MQAWWAEDTSLKNIKNLTVQNFWLVVYIEKSLSVFLGVKWKSVVTKTLAITLFKISSLCSAEESCTGLEQHEGE